MSLEIGMQGQAETTVGPHNTAQAAGSGSLPVFATPMMVALMEGAAVACIQKELPTGSTSVGGAIAVSHLSPTPLGCRVQAFARVTAFTEKKVEFSLWAQDEDGRIGEGTHTRFIVKEEPFMAKAQEKTGYAPAGG